MSGRIFHLQYRINQWNIVEPGIVDIETMRHGGVQNCERRKLYARCAAGPCAPCIGKEQRFYI